MLVLLAPTAPATSTPKHCTTPRPCLSTMQCRDEDNLVPVLEDVVELALELPVGVVDEHQDTGAAAVSELFSEPRLGQEAMPGVIADVAAATAATTVTGPSTTLYSHALAVHKHVLALADQVGLHVRDEVADVGRASVGAGRCAR